ncbi:thiamine-phosphate kinase [Tumebacillus algifaecis]|uniref:Thiamine-monophosphate kinase n=1 Tax=Tumebacillus algifaecis TaxID=1214604 RepID=A0A223D5C0_9BACL|nr:thiamine-phosphate kinase [Tumebacillus algifaecis]ASS76616.1 thiamine-phosphate kinase [Tumebacillus algifaecis]
MRIDELGEFGLIDRLAARLGQGDESVVVGIGDDAAVLQYASNMQVVTTTDMLVEGVHFRRDTIDDRSLGYRSLAVSISDIAAMGGRAKHAVISLAIPVDLEVERLEELYIGVQEICTEYGTYVVGGDVVKTTGPFVISVTVLGEVECGRALLRSGARPGDLIFLTGTAGGSAAGLDLLLHGQGIELAIEQKSDLLRFHQRPAPQILAGRLLQAGGCTSANDVSDGVSSELHEISKQSGVKLVVEAEQIPLHDSVRAYAALRGRDPLEWALFGGEDYQLIGTIDPAMQEQIKARFAEAGVEFTIIGQVEAGAGVTLMQDGVGRELPAKGFNHFGS